MYTQNRANNFNAKGEFIINEDLLLSKGVEYNLISFTTPSTTLAGLVLTKQSIGEIPSDNVINEQTQTIRFIIDENLEVYFDLLKIQEWNTKSNTFTFIGHILNNKRNVIACADYSKTWISSISGLQYEVQSDETTIYVDIQINFLKYNINKTN